MEENPSSREQSELQTRISDLQKTVRELQSLNALSQKISSEPNPDDVMAAILDHVMSLTAAEQGAIMVLSDDAEQTMKTVVRDLRGGESGVAYRLGTNVTGWVVTYKMPLVVPDITLDTRFEQIVGDESNIKSVLCVPLMVSNRVIGAISLINKPERGEFDREDLRVVSVVVGQSAQLLENARLTAALQAANAELEKARRELEIENISLREEVRDRYAFEGIVGRGAAMRALMDRVRHILNDSCPVLVTGESGTGKELIARAIHHNGNRRQGRFVAVSCAAMPETLLESELFGHVKGAFTDAVKEKKGLFEVAVGGTLFLDEIQHASPATQVKLLRALEEKEIRRVGDTKDIPVDVRIICATNEDLRALVEEKQFRRDLLYRINVVEIVVPPLRERGEDIPVLAEHFLRKYTQEKAKSIPGFKKKTLELLVQYPWSENNVRELENEIERAVIFAEDGAPIGPALLKEEIRSCAERAASVHQRGGSLEGILNSAERQATLWALEEADGNKARAARSLGIHRDRLYRIIKKYGIGQGG